MTRPPSEPIGIGIPDGTAGGVRDMRCPGAALVITRAEYGVLEQNGCAFSSSRDDIPYESKGNARVFCRSDVETVTRHHGVYRMGLCGRCSEMERNQRADLAARAAKAGSR